MSDPESTSLGRLLRELYDDEADGFQSPANLYKDAKAKNSAITMPYVKEWLTRPSSIQTHQRSPLWTSYVADHPLQQVAIDLADYSRSKQYNDGYCYICVCVDYFTKYAFAKALKTKKPDELTEALVDTIKAMGTPEAIIPNKEGGTQSPSFFWF
jgi:hypothetical protein